MLAAKWDGEEACGQLGEKDPPWQCLPHVCMGSPDWFPGLRRFKQKLKSWLMVFGIWYIPSLYFPSILFLLGEVFLFILLIEGGPE